MQLRVRGVEDASAWCGKLLIPLVLPPLIAPAPVATPLLVRIAIAMNRALKEGQSRRRAIRGSPYRFAVTSRVDFRGQARFFRFPLPKGQPMGFPFSLANSEFLGSGTFFQVSIAQGSTLGLSFSAQ